MDQGQYAQYPRPPVKEIDFAVIGEAFQLIFKHPGPMLVASFLGYFMPLCAMYAVTLYMEFQLGFFSPTASTDLSQSLDKIGQLYGAQLLMLFVMGVILAPFAYAMTKMTLKSVRGEAVEFNDVFSGFPHFGTALVVVVGTYLLASVSVIACCIGAPIVGGLLMFTLPLVVDRGISTGEAMRTSFEMLRPHMWMAMLLFIVFYILASLGVIACLIGVLVTFPVYFVVPTLVYRDFTMGRGMPVHAPPPAGDQS